MHLPRGAMTRAPQSREGSFTVAGAQQMAVGRGGSFEAARALAALRQQQPQPQPQTLTALAAALTAAANEAAEPQQQQQQHFQPRPAATSPERERLAFLSAALGNPTIAPDAAAVAVAALAMAGPPPPSPSPPPPPPPKQRQQQPQRQQQQHHQPVAASAEARPMSNAYSQHSQLQQSAVDVALPYIFRAAAQHVRFAANDNDAAALSPVVRVAEIGCASGSNTKAPVQALLAGLAARAHRARRAAAEGRAARERGALLQQKRRHLTGAVGASPAVFLTAAGDAGADEDDTAAGDAAAAFPLPAQVDLRLVDLPSNDWAAVAAAAGRLTAELAEGADGGEQQRQHQQAEAATGADAIDAIDDDDDAESLASDDDGSVASAVGADFDDDALAAGGPRLPPAPPASVFASASPRSMYDPAGVAPEASQHLVFSNTCASWQPHQHAPLPAGSSAAAFVSLTPGLRAQARELAARDGGALHAALELWRLGARRALDGWLRLRAEELADGGVLVFSLPCADEQAGEGGGNGDGDGEGEEEEEANSFATYMAPLVGAAVRDLLREGHLTPDEAEALAVPVCALPTQDLREVLQGVAVTAAAAAAAGGGGGGGGLFGGSGGDDSDAADADNRAPLFEVLELSKEVLPPHPAWYHYRTGAASALDLGRAYAEWAAAISAPFFEAQLAPRLAARGAAGPAGGCGPAAAREAAAAVVARLFRRVASRVAKDPRPLRYLPVVATLRRLPRTRAPAAAAAGF